jgi:hypothetical protein
VAYWHGWAMQRPAGGQAAGKREGGEWDRTPGGGGAVEGGFFEKVRAGGFVQKSHDFGISSSWWTNIL